jgi:hypothetical protein
MVWSLLRVSVHWPSAMMAPSQAMVQVELAVTGGACLISGGAGVKVAAVAGCNLAQRGLVASTGAVAHHQAVRAGVVDVRTASAASPLRHCQVVEAIRVSARSRPAE